MNGDGSSWGIWESSHTELMGFAPGLLADSPSFYVKALAPDDVFYSTPIALSGSDNCYLYYEVAGDNDESFAEHYSLYL